MKVAKLVWASIGTRVIVDDDATDEEIWAKAFPALIQNMIDNQMDSCESIEDDEEMPYGQGLEEQPRITTIGTGNLNNNN